ncbi:MAG: AcaB family transcriptional regulator [Gammaproteobacteria bacterium]|nr:AcaB family transcriptional regulator [Gammaproteobacteria bacterium]MCH9717269.1 AcaB family transcriptional regulator [Gammaproteobacteria bacterium]MCH9762873.1 AcaB family transcriptional regulator [Gammaproteobacteria bacterium]
MKVTITLNLKTREAHQLFQRKINNDRLFFNAILHQLNKIARLCRKEIPGAHEHYQNIQENLNKLSQQFTDEAKCFRAMLQKEEILKNKKITFHPRLSQKVIIENPLTINLMKLIEAYDELISIFKLLHLAGCFQSTQDYYANIRRIQKIVNSALSQVIFIHALELKKKKDLRSPLCD